MQQFKGNMRRIPNQQFNMQTPSRGMMIFNNQFHQGQKNKYDVSEKSYYQNDQTKSVYIQKSERFATKIYQKDIKQIYDNNIPIKIKSNQRQDYITFLRVQISKSFQKNLQIILINLTDDSNHQFLWTFYLKESDYMNLRNQQKIKMDFSGFPQMIVQHLGFVQNQKEVQVQTYFHCNFEIKKGGQAILNILQSNKYKESLHLSLKFKLASDQQIKIYLADKLTKQKQQNQQMRSNNSKLSDILNARITQLESLQLKFKQFSQEKGKQINAFSIKQQMKLNQLKQTYINRQKQIMKQKQNQIKKIKQSYENKIKQLEQKLWSNQNKYQILRSRALIIQQKEKSLTNQNQSLKNQLDNIKERQNKSNPYIKKLESQKFQDSKTITTLNCKIEQLITQLKDKDSIIQSSKQLKTSANSQVQNLQKKAEQYKKSLEKLQVKYEGALEEIAKANASIQQLKVKNDKKKQKINLKNEILKNQERVVKQLQSKVSEQKDKQFGLKRQKQQLQRKMYDLDIKNKQLLQKINQSEKKIQEDTSMITHLHKQLTQRTSGYRPGITNLVPNKYPVTTNYPRIQQPSQISASSRLRLSNSPTPLDKQRIQPVVRKYVPTNIGQETNAQFINNKLNRLNQQKDPQQINPNIMVSQMKGTKIKPIKYREPQ